MKNKNHVCTIGVLHYSDSDELADLSKLKEHIELHQEIVSYFQKRSMSLDCVGEAYTLKDYCDKRKNTDLTRFDFCPYCGERINWKEFKENENEIED